MHTIQLGSESEHIKITLPGEYSAEGWCKATVEIALPRFSGRIEPWLQASDIERFATELQELHASLRGEAKLRPVEEQFTLLVQARSGGHIAISGVARSEATYGARLAFEMELDQSYLPSTLAQLAAVGSWR